MGLLSLTLSLVFCVAFLSLCLTLTLAFAIDFPEGCSISIVIVSVPLSLSPFASAALHRLDVFCILSLCIPDTDRMMSPLCISPACVTRFFPLDLWSFSFICAITVSWSQPYSLVVQPCHFVEFHVCRLRPTSQLLACAQSLSAGYGLPFALWHVLPSHD